MPTRLIPLAQRWLHTLSVASGFMLAACQTPTSDGAVASDDPRPIVSSANNHRFDAARIDSARVERDILQLFVQYGGGCRSHRFALISSGVFLESYPVQVPLALSHDADGDMCRALKTSIERFDLASVRSAYLASYGKGGPVILQVREPGPDGKTVSVRYEVK